MDAPKPDTPNLLSYLYHHLSDHWWTVGMRSTAHAILNNNTIPNGPILEVGCGNCKFLSELSEKYSLATKIGMDINSQALEHGKSILNMQGTPIQGDFHHLPFMESSLALVIGLDAFDQTKTNLSAALSQTFKTLIKDGLLLIRVSAHPWLLGQHDRSFGTGRRYTKNEICSDLMQAGFDIERFTYANTTMLLPAIIVRIGINLGMVSVKNQFSTPKILNTLLTKILKLEAELLKLTSIPTGLSIYVLARKPK